MQILDLKTGRKADAPGPHPQWIDLDASEAGGLAQLGIADSGLKELMGRRVSSYIEWGTHTGMVLYKLSYRQTRFQRDPLYLFVLKKGVVTIGGAGYLERFHSDFIAEKKGNHITKERIVLELLSSIIDSNGSVSLEIDKEIARLEEQVSGAQPRLETQKAINLRRVLLRLSRHFWSQRQIIFDFKENRIHQLEMSPAMAPVLADLYNSMFFDISMNEQLHTLLGDLRELHLATVSNRINGSIKKLTVITVWFTIVATVSMVPNTIATVFGIPYFPIQAGVPWTIAGVSFLPWQLIALLLLISTLGPSLLLYVWWRRNKDGMD